MKFGKKSIIAAVALTITTSSLLIISCAPAAVVRVWNDVGGGPHRNFDVNSNFSDLTNDYYDADSGGGSMGGTISAVANFSDQYIMFGSTLCIGPQTFVPNLSDVEIEITGCVASSLPFSFILGWEDVIFAITTTGCWGDSVQTIRQRNPHTNLNDSLWSYLGTTTAEDCKGTHLSNGNTLGGNTLIERGMLGTANLAAQ
jgi:hypothetical protein